MPFTCGTFAGQVCARAPVEEALRIVAATKTIKTFGGIVWMASYNSRLPFGSVANFTMLSLYAKEFRQWLNQFPRRHFLYT